MDDITDALKFGKLLVICGKNEKAIDVFDKLTKKWPNDFRPFFNLGTCLVRQYRYGEALIAFESVLKLTRGTDKMPLEVFGALAKVLLSLQRPEDALIRCQEGLALDPMDHICLSNLNIALRMLDRMDEAVDISWNAMGIVPFDKSSIMASPSSSSSSKDSQIIVVCLKWGKKYGAEYVNNLYYMLARHGLGERPFRLICFTEESSGIIPEIECKPLPDLGWTGWWYKAYLFSCEAFVGEPDGADVVYLDLDTVVCGSLGFLIEGIDKNALPTFSTLGVSSFSTEGRRCGVNTSIMTFGVGNLSLAYSYLKTHYSSITKVLCKFDHFVEMIMPSDTKLIESIYPDNVVDYQDLMIKHNSEAIMASNISIIIFPLKPKPHELPKESTIRGMWDLETEET